jgi:hypothetical protein
MKTLLMSLICTFTCLSLFAQVDSTNNTNNTNPTTVTPQTTTPTTNNNATDTAANMNSTNSNMNSTNSNTNSNNSNMNSNNNMNSNMSSMNRMDSSSMVNTSNIAGQAHYAALPVLETYVPDNIVAAVKQEHDGSYIYDITAVKAPMDSTMAANTMNQNSTTMTANTTTTTTNTATATDSTHQNATATTNTTVNTNAPMGQNANNMSTPQEYQYVVRYLQGGTMTTEILNNSGTKVNNP